MSSPEATFELGALTNTAPRRERCHSPTCYPPVAVRLFCDKEKGHTAGFRSRPAASRHHPSPENDKALRDMEPSRSSARASVSVPRGRASHRLEDAPPKSTSLVLTTLAFDSVTEKLTTYRRVKTAADAAALASSESSASVSATRAFVRVRVRVRES